MWNGNYSSVAFLADQNQWNVNSSNISNYCFNVLSGSYCYNESYDPFTTPRTCNDTWGFDCGNQTGNGTTNYYGLNDSFLSCDGTQYKSSRYVKQAYLNASSVFFGDEINATCEFVQLTGRIMSEYIWYNNDSTSNNNWLLLWNNIDNSTSGTFNYSVTFIPNSSEATQIVRCILNENTSGYSSAMPSGAYCVNSSTGGNGWDNDDVNFTVTENDTGNITYEVCENSVQNITANDSIYFNGFDFSYFYPVSNPFEFYNSSSIPYYINYTWNITYANWNKTYADTLYSSITEPLWTANFTDYNTTWSKMSNDSYDYQFNTTLVQNNSNSYWQIGVNDSNSSAYTLQDINTTERGLFLLTNTSTEMITAVNTSATPYNITLKNMTLPNGAYIKLYNSTGLASCITANDTYSLMILSTC
jgi:hypothetical protein